MGGRPVGPAQLCTPRIISTAPAACWYQTDGSYKLYVHCCCFHGFKLQVESFQRQSDMEPIGQTKEWISHCDCHGWVGLGLECGVLLLVSRPPLQHMLCLEAPSHTHYCTISLPTLPYVLALRASDFPCAWCGELTMCHCVAHAEFREQASTVPRCLHETVRNA